MIARISLYFVFFLLFLLCFSISTSVVAEDKVSLFFKNLTTITANFEQIVENAQLSSTEKASGKLWIERPGKFRWDYSAPYEQQIVSDGEKIWIFDKDLEQVTVRPVGLSMGNTPAVLLSGAKPVTDTFIVNEIGEFANLHWVELSPKDPEASFTVIRLGFDGLMLSEMLLEDNLGQKTRLHFLGLKRNNKIAPEKFVFTPPPGVDVFETTE